MRPTTPLLAADIVIIVSTGSEISGDCLPTVVLIERLNEPTGLALPGGFVDLGESVQSAAVREAKEEVSVDVELFDMLGVFSEPGRDPRGDVASVVFVAGIIGGTLCAADDARALVLHDLNDGIPDGMVFDHASILQRLIDNWDSNRYIPFEEQYPVTIRG
jgi:8-oxo-dGTP diphosphatase